MGAGGRVEILDFADHELYFRHPWLTAAVTSGAGLLLSMVAHQVYAESADHHAALADTCDHQANTQIDMALAAFHDGNPEVAADYRLAIATQRWEADDHATDAATAAGHAGTATKWIVISAAGIAASGAGGAVSALGNRRRTRQT